MESLDDLLNFSSDIGEEDDKEDKPRKTLLPLSSTTSLKKFNGVLGQDDPSRSFHEFEDLEWISNKDLFPAVETFVDILSDHPVGVPKHHSPVSVLESSTTSSNSNCNSQSQSQSHSTNSNSNLISSCGSLKAPRRARSKRRCRRRRAGFADVPGRQQWWSLANSRNAHAVVKVEAAITTTTIGRKCQHCGVEKTPQWRAGPLGPKTLCNACGVRYKSGRLAPEYRPASSPTFSSEKHSNSHRKVMEMRRAKQMMGMVVKPLGSG